MKNNSIFFCDLIGTYVKSLDIHEKEETIKKFINALSKLINDDERLFFTFTSTENFDIVRKYLEELKLYNTNPNIIPYIDEAFDHNKFSKIDIIMSTLENNNFKNIYFADDTQIYHEILECLISEKCDNSNFTAFNLSTMNNNIVDLTNLINEHNINVNYK